MKLIWSLLSSIKVSLEIGCAGAANLDIDSQSAAIIAAPWLLGEISAGKTPERIESVSIWIG